MAVHDTTFARGPITGIDHRAQLNELLQTPLMVETFGTIEEGSDIWMCMLIVFMNGKTHGVRELNRSIELARLEVNRRVAQ